MKRKKGEKAKDEPPETRSLMDLLRRKPREQTSKDILMGPAIYDPATGKGVAYDAEGGRLRPRPIQVPTLTCPHSECDREFTEERHLQHHREIDNH